MYKGFIKNTLATVLGLTVLLAANGASALTLPSMPAFVPVLPPAIFIPTPVQVSVSANSYPENTSIVQNAYVNMYAVTPATAGIYSGKLLATKKVGLSGSATFDVMPGQVVDFVTFADDKANLVKHWTSTVPPYKNFGSDGNRICQINYLDSNSKLISGGTSICTNGMSLPLSSRYVDNTVSGYFPLGTQFADFEVSVQENGDPLTRVKDANVYLYDYSTNHLIGNISTGNRGIVTFIVRRDQKFYFYAQKNGVNYGGYLTSATSTPRVFYVTSDGEHIKNDFEDAGLVGTSVLRLGAYPNTVQLQNVLIVIPTQVGTPSIINPTQNQVFTNYPRNTYVAWTPATNAVKYEGIVEYLDGTWKYNVGFSTQNTHVTTDALIGDNSFRVSVRGIAADGTVGMWSASRPFSYRTPVAPTQVGTPSIVSPTQNQVLTNFPRKAYISWTSASNADVYEGEVDILVETGWRSDFKFSISAGSTSITTDALDGDNNFRVRMRALATDGTVGNWTAYKLFSYKTTPAPTQVGTPSIINPTQNQVLTNFPRVAYVDWTSASNANKYEVTIDWQSGADWHSGIVQTTQNVYIMPTLGGDNKYRTRVRAIAADNTIGAWSDYRLFSYLTSPSVTPTVVTEAPVITYPTQNLVVSNETRSITIRWNAVANAEKYDARVSVKNSSGNWINVAKSDFTADTDWTTTSVLTDNTTYLVSVRGVSKGGIPGPQAERLFTYKQSTATPIVSDAPVITSPLNNQNIDNSKFSFTWNAVNNAVKYDMILQKMVTNGNWITWANYSSLSETKVTVTDMVRSSWYQVRVRGIAANGSVGPWSGYTKFYLKPVAMPVVRANEVYFVSRYFGDGLNANATMGASFALEVTGDVRKGYNFKDLIFTGYSGGAFYVTADTNDNNFAKIWGNNIGQGGAIDMGYVSMDSVVPSSDKTKYNKGGVAIMLNHVYAIYDEANGKFALVKPLVAGSNVELIDGSGESIIDETDGSTSVADINLATASVKYGKKISTGEAGFQVKYTLDNLSSSTQKVMTEVYCLIPASSTIDNNAAHLLDNTKTVDLATGKKSFSIFQPLTSAQVAAVNNLKNNGGMVTCKFKSGRFYNTTTGITTVDGDLTNNVISIDLHWKFGRLRQNSFRRDVEYTL